jgi:DNA repair exonuclease SbcCD ATPase subunit
MRDQFQREPIPYPALQRMADRREGKRDGRRGIPVLPAESFAGQELGAMTPYLDRLRRDCWLRIRQEQAGLEAARAGPARQLETLRQRIADADEGLADLRKQIEDMPPHPPGDPPPAPGPTYAKGKPDREEMGRRRQQRAYDARQQAHDARRRDLETQAQRASTELKQMRAEAAELAQTIAGQERITAAAIEELREHAQLRASAYLGGLVDKHDEGKILNAILQPFLSGQVDWLTAP